MDSIESQTLKMENEIDGQEVIETPESVEETVETPEESADDKIARLEAEKAELEDRNKKLYARVKKDDKPVEKKVETQSISGMSLTDSVAILNAKVHEDDIERVERFAKSEGVSIKDALKNPEMKAILDMREEQRTVASASNVSNVRRGSTKVSDDVLISNARANKLPESDDDIARLISAKAKQKD